VPVQRADADPGAARDLLQRGAVRTALGEDLGRGAQQALLVPLSVRALRLGLRGGQLGARGWRSGGRVHVLVT
jgi:hypothetical protein